jgi:uncharacterized BrkB/YihY/UPF0761 family membrane protein
MDKASIKVKLKNTKAGVDDRLHAALDEAERRRSDSPAVESAFGVVAANRRTAASLLAGGLAYRFFLWALPFALFSAAAFRLIADAAEKSNSELAKELGMGAAMAGTVGRAAGATGRSYVVLLLVGLVLMLIAAKSVWKSLCISSELAWDMRSDRRDILSADRQRSLIPTLVVAGVLLGLSLLNAAASVLYGGGIVTDLVAAIVTAGVIAGTLTWAGRALPHPDGVPWLHFIPGAIAFALGMALLRLITAVYLAGKLDRADDLYGALGIAAVFMAFLYLLGRLVMVWLIVNAEWHRAHSAVLPSAPREPS